MLFQVVYVPAGFWHATEHPTDDWTLAVGGQGAVVPGFLPVLLGGGGAETAGGAESAVGALWAAAQVGHVEVLRALLDTKKVDASAPFPAAALYHGLEPADDAGDAGDALTPLYFAAVSGHTEVCIG